MMANALIFFHMARVNSLELSAGPARILAFSLIVASIVLVIGSTCIYAQRALDAARSLPARARRSEQRAVGCTLAFFAAMCVIASMVGYAVLHGSVGAITAWAKKKDRLAGA